MLKLTNLSISANGESILEDINLEVKAGEIHVILGPNGAGKSTIANAIAGNPELKVTKGRINFKRKNITEIPPDERSKLGILMTFQDPPDLDGVNSLQFARDTLKERGDKRSSTSIIQDYKNLVKKLDLGSDWPNRSFNSNASGGERKKNEVLQCLMMDPDLVILDEIDSGLDVDSISTVGVEIAQFLTKKNKACIIITHQPNILELIKPTHVHVVVNGSIVESGTNRILKRILKNGYREFS
jgi:Fe-S cluster assembly ATP-binding protein